MPEQAFSSPEVGFRLLTRLVERCYTGFKKTGNGDRPSGTGLAQAGREPFRSSYESLSLSAFCMHCGRERRPSTEAIQRVAVHLDLEQVRSFDEPPVAIKQR